ncbi:MAG: FHA domain-containing protein [Planctomycetaceae bacterium]
MKVVLELQEALANVRRVTVRHDIVIGRGSDCNLRLSAPQMSRRHCFLRVGREGVSVTDLDSSNGTYVDNKRIKPGDRVELVTGSILTLGPVNFIVHLKADSDAPPKSEGERTRSRSKPPKPSSESSTIVSSAAAIVAEESKGKTRSDREKSVRTKGEAVAEAGAKQQKSSQEAAKTRDDVAGVATDTGKKAASVAAVATPAVEQLAKPTPTSPPPAAESVAEKIDDDVESPAAESSWLTDDSPDDLSFFGGQQSDDAVEGAAGPEIVDVIEEAGAVDDVQAVDEVVEEVVEVLEEDDIFAEEVVEAALIEEPVDAVEAVEVLDEEPMDVVEVLEDETSANAITADLDESDLFDEQFVEVLAEPEVLAEEVAAVELIEEIEEPAEVVAVLEDGANVDVLESGLNEASPNDAELVEVLEESTDFFDQLGIVEEERQETWEPAAVVDAAVEESAVDVEDAGWFEESVEVLEVVDEVVPPEAPQSVAAEPELNDAELVDVLEEPSDFFESLGIEAEPEPVIEEIAAVEVAEVFADVSAEAEPVVESASAVEVTEEETAVELLDEPSDFFDSLGIEVEPEPAIEEVAAVEAGEVFADASVEAEPAAESSSTVEAPEEEVAVELMDEPSDFFDRLGIAVEPGPTTEDVASAEVVAGSDDSSETDWFSDAVEQVVDIVEEQPAAVVEVNPALDALEQLAVTEAVPSWEDIELSDVAEPAAQGEFDFLDDQEADVIIEAAADAPVADAESEAATADEPAEVDAEIEVVEEFDFFDDVEAVEPTAAAEHVDAVEEFDAEVEEVALFEEVAEEDVVAASEEAVDEVVAEDEVVEVAEEEGSNWFSVGGNNDDDDDDSALREFLKGF